MFSHILEDNDNTEEVARIGGRKTRDWRLAHLG
jgi:hypothetical protein